MEGRRGGRRESGKEGEGRGKGRAREEREGGEREGEGRRVRGRRGGRWRRARIGGIRERGTRERKGGKAAQEWPVWAKPTEMRTVVHYISLTQWYHSLAKEHPSVMRTIHAHWTGWWALYGMFLPKTVHPHYIAASMHASEASQHIYIAGSLPLLSCSSCSCAEILFVVELWVLLSFQAAASLCGWIIFSFQICWEWDSHVYTN